LAAATILFASTDAFPALVLARALQGIAATTSWTAGLALIAAVYPANERGRPFGLALSASAVGILLGPAIGGLLADYIGVHAPFVLAAIVAVADGIARMILIPRLGIHPAANGLVAVWRHRLTGLLFGLTALGAGLLAFLQPIAPLHVSGVFSGSSSTIGLLFAAAVLGGAFVAPLGGQYANKVPQGRMAAAGALAAATGLLVISLAHSLWLFGCGLILVTIGAQLVLVPTLALIATIADTQ